MQPYPAGKHSWLGMAASCQKLQSKAPASFGTSFRPQSTGVFTSMALLHQCIGPLHSKLHSIHRRPGLQKNRLILKVGHHLLSLAHKEPLLLCDFLNLYKAGHVPYTFEPSLSEPEVGQLMHRLQTQQEDPFAFVGTKVSHHVTIQDEFAQANCFALTLAQAPEPAPGKPEFSLVKVTRQFVKEFVCDVILCPAPPPTPLTTEGKTSVESGCVEGENSGPAPAPATSEGAPSAESANSGQCVEGVAAPVSISEAAETSTDPSNITAQTPYNPPSRVPGVRFMLQSAPIVQTPQEAEFTRLEAKTRDLYSGIEEFVHTLEVSKSGNIMAPSGGKYRIIAVRLKSQAVHRNSILKVSIANVTQYGSGYANQERREIDIMARPWAAAFKPHKLPRTPDEPPWKPEQLMSNIHKLFGTAYFLATGKDFVLPESPDTTVAQLVEDWIEKTVEGPRRRRLEEEATRKAAQQRQNEAIQRFYDNNGFFQMIAYD
eukprot:NODE_1393_length_1523_cov_14.290115_g1318_i0.p1 GENE.NODE_1393_length_1523_cov_14.290115_g1318_i0~~NODE_1393_length_1523_cov_14.290115_g1318_i0.p1  ORF type:complete len:502 (-),score=102.60 NODE_1393_length_1523_cov_14.290115_g1318_i0:16-1476(-)